MYAIVETGGKQYRVAPGDIIRVEQLPGEKGASASVGRVLAVAQDKGGLLTGKQVSAAKVEGTILRQARAPKVLVSHYKRKKQYKKTQGHRQGFTELRVDKVTL
jgi:large subunit ribosomal protein L21